MKAQPTPRARALPAHRGLAVLALAAVLASFFAGLGRAPLFDVDEGAFGQATLEMFQRGDFLSTYLNGQPRYDKPILVYWLQAASVAVLGVSELALRLPSSLCAALWALSTYLFARRFYGTRPALLTAAMLATSLGVHVIGRAATADALLNCLIAASMFAAYLHLETGKRAWRYATFAAAGLGFLAKGPVAVVIPLTVTFLFCWLRRDLGTWLRAVADWRGALLFAVIALPWYAVILAREGWPFIQGFFLEHNVGRFRGPLQGHAGSLLYYVPVTLAWTLPYTGPLLLALRRLRAAWRDDLQCYLLLWFGFVFVLFSLSGTKLPHYLLYGITGLVVLMGASMPQLKRRPLALLPSALFLVVLLALPWVVPTVLEARLGERLLGIDPYYREALGDLGARLGPGPGLLVVTLAGLALASWAMLDRRADIPASLVAAATAGVLVISLFVVPALGDVLQGPVKEAAALCRAQGLAPVTWKLNAPSFSVYRGAPTPSRKPAAGDVVITKARYLHELPRHEPLYARNGIALVRITG